MPDAASAEVVVVVPAGPSIIDAADWVGHACWAELRLHQVLTDWLGSETDPKLSASLWRIRSNRAAVAAAWHRRLPELHELPRAGFVEPSASGEEAFAALDALTASGASDDRVTALRTGLAKLGARYEQHVAVAVGPADGPTAATLADAIRTTAADGASLAAWTPQR